MCFVSFYINGAEWTSRTEILALATANTFLNVHHRDAEEVVDSTPIQLIAVGIVPLSIIRILLDALVYRHHLNGLSRTMSSAASALLVLRSRQTVLLHPYSMSNLDGSLLLFGDRFDGTSRADIRTACTLRAAIAVVILHLWLQEMCHTG